MTMTSIDERKRMARRSLEMWAGDSTDSAEAVFAPTYVNHQEPDAKGTISELDLERWRDVVRENHRAFPDLEVQVLSQVCVGDEVATRWQFTGTNSGGYLGHPPTGRQATWTGVQIDRFADGKIVESWVNWDKYRLFDELGFVP